MSLTATSLAFAALAYAATRFGAWLCRASVPFADGPTTRTPNSLLFVCAAALVGGATVLRQASIMETVVIAVLTAALAACCYCDVRWGIVPDECTVVPLAVVLALSLFARDIAPVIASLIVFAPFALAALLSKGRGLGWGDVKLAALVASVLGTQATIAACIVACFAAAASAAIRRKKSEPIAFAPYLAGSAAIALMLPPFR